MNPKKIRILIMTAVSATVLMGCEQQKDTPTQTQAVLQPCPGFAETGKPPLVHSAECGRLMVKENPSDPESKEIPIEILRLPSISPAAEADPLFLIQGGPGGSSVDMANFIHPFFADVRKNRDLVFVDQRGTGRSNPLHCDGLNQLDMRLPHVEMMTNFVGELRKCAERYGDSLRHYTTHEAVQDIDAVRTALGYKKINLWGVSYGTRVALEYARRFPQSTRALVLDGVAPKEIALSKYIARDTLAAFKAVNAECQSQEDCAYSFGDLLVQAETVYSRLDSADKMGQPVSVDYEHPSHQRPENVRLSAPTFSQLIFSALYSRDLTALLPQAIHEAAKENYRLLAALFALSVEQSQKMDIAYAMHFSVICNEDWYYISATDVETTPPFFGLDPLKDRNAVCSFWPKAHLPGTYFSPLESDVPALLLSGKRDPVTPPVWAEVVAKGLPNSTRLVADGGNHSISMEGCVPQIIAQFIEQGSMRTVNTECVERIRPLPFVLGASHKQVGLPSSNASSAMSQSSSSQSSALLNEAPALSSEEVMP